jgi:hypothetical protein
MRRIPMAYNHDRAIGCVIGFNAVTKAVRYVEKHDHIDPRSSQHVRRVFKVIYGKVIATTAIVARSSGLPREINRAASGGPLSASRVWSGDEPSDL